MTIRFRIIAGYAVLVSVTILALLFTMRLLIERISLRQLVVHHEVEAAEFVAMAEQQNDPATEARWRLHTDLDAGLYKFFVMDVSGREVHRSVALKDESASFLRATPDGRVRLGRDLGECLVTSHTIGRYVLRVVTPLEVPLSVTKQFYEIGALALGLGLALSLVSGVMYSRWVLRPVVRMEDAARRIAAEGHGARIPQDISETGDEIGRLAMLLNAGYDRLDASTERLRRFTADVSHELRTPLSILRLSAGRIRETPDVPESARELALDQIGEIERMNRFIGDLLGFAKLDAGAVAMESREVRVAEWLADFSEDAAALAEDAGCRFEADAPADCVVRIDPVRMRQVMLNLLSNALRVSPKGGLVRVAAARDGDLFRLWLEDEGPGLPPERLETVFERYVRFGENQGASEGIGLGLAISRSIVTLHGGSIRAENRAGGRGLRVIINLPAPDAV